MVFESIVVDVLNRFLGEYVENLNKNQLKIGIWGGDVVLENLILKQNALEELNIPVQVVYGHLGKLVLKIPWKNLYGASVEASIEKLFIIVNPIAEVKYDPEKEEKIALANKQAELKRIDEAKKLEAEKDAPKVDDTFVEKLVSQIIKNVQLQIKDIHIRYEDTITNPSAPFSLGVSLYNLAVHTTDENWKQTVVQEAVTKIFKILTLEGLALYWNPNCNLYSKLEKSEILNIMKNEIATKSSKPNNYYYVLGPINSTAKLKLNTKPENDMPAFTIPKVILSLHMEELGVKITRKQYQDMIKMVDSMDRMAKGLPYRKYRPNVPSYRGFYKKWWQFAYKSILEEEVRRKRRNWDWEHILNHRNICRAYAKAYQEKLTIKKCSSTVQNIIETSEKALDLVNLVIIRQKIELEVERLGKKEEEQKGRGWLSSWWYGPSDADDELAENTAILTKFEKAMTQDEKNKLFRAIDYQENTAPLHLPTEFVAVAMEFKLDKLGVTLSKDNAQVLQAMVENVGLKLSQRPSANAIKVEVEMKDFNVHGVKQGNRIPKMVRSQFQQSPNLVDIVYETNPLDNKCGQRIIVKTEPLEIVYDAQTIIDIVQVFSIPEENSTLAALQVAAGNTISDLKEKSNLRLEYAVNKHIFLELDVQIASSVIIIPNRGVYTGSESCIVAQLGAITMTTKPRTQQCLDIHNMYKQGICDEEILKELIEYSYDAFELKLTDMQVLICAVNEDWKKSQENFENGSYILEKTTLKIDIEKCLLTDDPRLPKLKIRAVLDKIAVNTSEDRWLLIMEILLKMPLPKSESTTATTMKHSESAKSDISMFHILEKTKPQPLDTHTKSSDHTAYEEVVQMTEIEAYFVLHDIIFNIIKKESSLDDRVFSLQIHSLDLKFTKKTFVMNAQVRLKGINFLNYRPPLLPIKVIETVQQPNEDNDSYLFKISYWNVDKKSPDFKSYHQCVEQLIKFDFYHLRLHLHMTALKDLLIVLNDFQSIFQDNQESTDRIAYTHGILDTIIEEAQTATSKKAEITAKPKSRKHGLIDAIQLKILVTINAIDVEFTSHIDSLAITQFHGMHAGLVIKPTYTQIDCRIDKIQIIDMNPVTIHKKILKVKGDNMLSVQIVIYNKELFPYISVNDITIAAEINQIIIVFLNRFVSSMLDYLNNFQAAQEAIIEASSQAAEQAKANVQNAYKNSTKVELIINLHAPIVLAPESSTSRNVIMVDFGLIKLSNTIQEFEFPDAASFVAIDDLTLSLEDLKMSYLRLSPELDCNLTTERVLIEPISFKLHVKRNLSNWYESIPNLDISGELQTIKLKIRNWDYGTIMKILNENLQEGGSYGNSGKPITKVEKSVASVTQNADRLNEIKEEKSDSKIIRTVTKFAFNMNGFIISLYYNSEAPGYTALTPEELEKFKFASLSFHTLSMKGKMFSDDSMHTSIILVDCTLDDKRPSRLTKIVRYFERRQDDDSNINSNIIDITYTMKNSDTFIDMRIFSFNLIISADFLLKVIEFTNTQTKDVEVLPVKAMTIAPAVKGPPEPIKSMMTVNIKLEKPYIILVESLDNKNAEALILNMELIFKMRSSKDRTVMEGYVSELQLYRKDATDNTHYYVLEPCNLSLAGAQPSDTGMHVDIAISEIVINVSPETTSLLYNVMETITHKEEDDSEEEKETIVYQNLWDMKPFEQSDYWFLNNADVALEASEIEKDQIDKKKLSGEICLLACPSITVAVHFGVGENIIPMILMTSSLQSFVKDWSSDLNVESTLTLKLSYYNYKKALWEPLLEPLEVLKDNEYKYVPYELKVEVTVQGDEPEESITNLETIATCKPNTNIIISSIYTLELTLTSTCIEVLNELSAMYTASLSGTEYQSKSALTVGTTEKIKRVSPFVLSNDTGYDVELILDNADFEVFKHFKGNKNSFGNILMKPNSVLPLQIKLKNDEVVKLRDDIRKLTLYIKILRGNGETFRIPIEQANIFYFPLPSLEDESDPPILISEIVMQNGAIHIYLRSCVTILNELNTAVDVFYMTEDANEVTTVGTIPAGETMRLPLQSVYTNELFFLVEGFSVCTTPFNWRSIEPDNVVTQLHQCPSKDPNLLEYFYIKAVGKLYKAAFGKTSQLTFHESSDFKITLKPAVKIQNSLPVTLTISNPHSARRIKLLPGEMVQLTHVEPYKETLVFLIENYLEKCWHSQQALPAEGQEFSVWSLDSFDGSDRMTLDLGMHNVEIDEVQTLTFYCPFWMVNKTERILAYRTDYETNNVVFHRPEYTDPIMFSFRPKNFFGKKKASIRLEFGDWSDKFSLDVAGSAGVVVCKNEGKMYTFSVRNQLTSNNLTKIVIFTPFFLIFNDGPFDIECQEHHRSADPWILIKAGSTIPLWPATERDNKLLILRVYGTKEITPPFVYTREHTTTLRLDNEYGGLNTEIQINERGTFITIRQYQPNTAPALLLNCTNSPVVYFEKGDINIKTLNAKHSILYTWLHPADASTLVLQSTEDIELDLRKDDIGDIVMSNETFWWVSTLDGLQRVIIITADNELAQSIYIRGRASRLDQQVTLELHAVGLSLVNDVQSTEIIYLSISSTGIIWERCKIGSRRYKKYEGVKSALLEEAYQRYLTECAVSENVSSIVQVDSKFEVDFAQMRVLRPSSRLLRRTAAPGVWIGRGVGGGAQRLHLKIQNIQIEQHVPNAMYPIMLAVVAPPKTVTSRERKPFIEISIVERLIEHSNVRQYDYFKVLVQEFQIKVDMLLINAMMEMFPSKTYTEEDVLLFFTNDLNAARKSLEEYAGDEVASDQKHHYDILHLSPLKIHLSFSLGGAKLPTFIGPLLQSIGVTLTDLNDVIFKLAYYERQYEFMSQRQLMSQVTSHYSSQAIKQMYVLVFGLDVIGNPYGLVLGLKKGVEDLFYEPFQGAIQGPSEFAEGLCLGVRSLVGHTVGGAAGAVSRITSAMGHGLASLTLDDEYQASRRQQLNEPVGTLQEGLARSGKGLIMGVVDGVTGVFTKPVEGAKNEGVEGFFKGLGKGAVGLVARPTAGIVDFASGSLNAVKRATDLNDDINQVRVGRALTPGGPVLPYSARMARGCTILKQLDKGKYLTTDTYVCHANCGVSNEMVVCSDLRIFYLSHSSFGGWQIVWVHQWNELAEKPLLFDKGIIIQIPKKKVFGMFPSTNNSKTIIIPEENQRKYIYMQCLNLFEQSR